MPPSNEACKKLTRAASTSRKVSQQNTVCTIAALLLQSVRHIMHLRQKRSGCRKHEQKEKKEIHSCSRLKRAIYHSLAFSFITIEAFFHALVALLIVYEIVAMYRMEVA